MIDDDSLPKEVISERRRKVLNDSGITQIEMYSPLWFWSRKGFKFKME